MVARLCYLVKSILIDDYAEGRDMVGKIDLVLVGNNTKYIGQKIGTLFSPLTNITK